MDLQKPVRVISDLHLGHPACRIEKVDQLTPLFSGAGMVVFNGDTAELRSRKLRPRGEELLRELRELVSGMGIESVFLRGNHDPQISDREYQVLGEQNAVVIHGDCWYDNLSPWNPKIWELESVFAEIRKRYPPNTLETDLDLRLRYTQECRLVAKGGEGDQDFSSGFKKIHSALRLIYPFRRPVEIIRCWKELGNRTANIHRNFFPDKKWIVFGHIHRPGIVQLPGNARAINTGGFLSVGNAWVADFAGEFVVVRKVNESGRGSFRLGTEKLRVRAD